jgi:hypothetical protein
VDTADAVISLSENFKSTTESLVRRISGDLYSGLPFNKRLTIDKKAVKQYIIDKLNDSNATFIADGIGTDYIVSNLDTGEVATVISVISDTSMILSKDIFLSSGDDYKIFSPEVKEADKVSVGKITMLNASNLTQPSEMYLSYTLEGESIKIYPKIVDTPGQVQAIYFRFPKDPKWTYFTFPNGEPMFDQSQPDYQDFELPLEDEYKLVMKILQYAGVSIREQEVAAYALGQEQHEQPTFSQQQ